MSFEQTEFKKSINDPRRVHAVGIRAQVEAGIREFFAKQNFLETRTPMLVRSPGMEPHIRPFQLTTGEFLPTSPEFGMKKLLVGGLERIFQICPCFRVEPPSLHHLPEFTMLEWYRAGVGFEAIMQDSEHLIEFLAQKILGRPEIPFGGKRISLKTPWPRLKIRDLYKDMVGLDLGLLRTAQQLKEATQHLGIETSPTDSWDDLYFRIWMEKIEPKLPQEQAVFVERFPASQAALAVAEVDPDGSAWARRFEIFMGGLELGNAFEELTDPIEQTRRFRHDQEVRRHTHGAKWPESPIDEEFIGALEEGLPACSGIALGVDRLIMLLANEADIQYTFWLPPFVGSRSR